MYLYKGEDKTLIFNKNIASLRIRSPEIADLISRISPDASYEIVSSKSGKPSLKIRGIAIHSLYDPEKEAETWVRHYTPEFENADVVYVLGFGLGYHILALCRKYKGRIVVIEPDIKTLKIALETVDLAGILNRIKIIDKIDIRPEKVNIGILEHTPSVNSNPEFLRIKSKLLAIKTLNRGLRILVAGPVYGGSLTIARYCARALRRLGHDVELMDNSRFENVLMYSRNFKGNAQRYQRLNVLLSEYISEALLARVDTIHPDIVFVIAQAPITQRCLEELRSEGVTTIFWFVEDFRVMQYWREIARYYDFFFTIQRGRFFEELEKMGVKHYGYLPLCASPDVHRPLNLTLEEQEYYGSDISFVGAGYYNRRHFFKGLIDMDLKIWGSEWDMNSALSPYIQRNGQRIETEEVIKIYNATKININLHSSPYHKDINPYGDFVNPRTFEIACCGAFQLVDKREEIPHLFEVGKEIICFESIGDLREKIHYYLKNRDERIEIAVRARQRVLNEHTYDKRMEEMLVFMVERGFYPQRKGDGFMPEELIIQADGDSELKEFLENFRGRSRISLEDIIEHIRSGEGKLSRTDKIFLMMGELAKIK